MKFISASILFISFIIVYLLIAEVFTVIFRLTGLSKEKSRFQVISLLTNSGYTTSESEVIANSKTRRRIATITMIFGYSFTVTIVSALVNIFLSLRQSDIENILSAIIIPIIVMTLIIFLWNNKYFLMLLDNFIEKYVNKILFKNNKNHIVLLDHYGTRIIAQIHISKLPQCMRGIPLEQLKLPETHGVSIMLIKRKGKAFDIVNKETVFKENDVLVAFGKADKIHMLFETSAFCNISTNTDDILEQ